VKEKVAHLVLSAVLGTGIGWAANAMTLAPRVSAIEQSMSRVQATLDAISLQLISQGHK
jgi:hypothetical protein